MKRINFKDGYIEETKINEFIYVGITANKILMECIKNKTNVGNYINNQGDKI